MVEETAELLAEYVYDLVGDGLRTVVIVSNDDHEVYYLNDDLQQEYTRETYAEVVDTFRLEDPFLSPELAGKPVGERRALIDYHEKACVIQLPYSDSETILISVSRDAGRDLIEFVESCREIVREQA
ncbi:hypothetical protein [Halobacterium wangiae]|uniref:hypothetical protein n=1 Tax=Halobacterium wangiae TaxID=2902623 RepID=UPI001E443804|nr:hypothetical protein [Halobacterium wangiae]